MAPPQKRRSRNSTGKERATETHYSHRRYQKQPKVLRQLQVNQSFSVPELVYRLLNTDIHNQGTVSVQRGVKPSQDRALYRDKIRKYQDLRDPSDDASSVHESSASRSLATGSEYTKSGATSTTNLSRVMKVKNRSWASGSADSSVSNISIEPITLANSTDNTRALLKKKSLVQIINNYIKAGIEEGKRHAKRYIRKALSFGVKSGYLIPTDPQGQVIRVSPTLVESRRSDPQSRRKRRRARQGDEDLSYVDRKEQRRRATPPLTTKRKLRRDASLDKMIPQKRRKTSVSKKPGMNCNLNYAATKKKDAPVARQSLPGNRKKKDQMAQKPTAKRSKEMIRRRHTTRHKDDAVEQRESRKSRSTKSPYTAKQAAMSDCSKCREDLTDEDDNSTKSSDNDANRKTVTERRKSESSGDIDGADENPGNPLRVVVEQVESSNNNETDKTPVEIVH